MLEHLFSLSWQYYCLLSLLLLVVGRRFFNGPWVKERRDLTGKLIIITGCNTGIGKATAEDLLRSGADVIYACRDKGRAMAAIESIKDLEMRKRADFLSIDLCDMDSISSFAETIKRKGRPIHALINNAGAIFNSFNLSKDGIEQTHHANHFGHKLLILLLLDSMDRSGSRILNVSSSGALLSYRNADSYKMLREAGDFEFYRDGYSGWYTYFDTKLANFFFTKSLSQFLESKYQHIKTCSLHPGIIPTEIARDTSLLFKIQAYLLSPLGWYVSKSVEAGAQTTLFLVYEDLSKIQNGQMYWDLKRASPNRNMKDENNRCEFMKWSWEVLNRAVSGRYKYIDF